VVSQHNDLSISRGTGVKLSGRFPSVRNNPAGSLVMGIPAQAKLRAITSYLGHNALLTCPGLFCKQRCEAHEHQENHISSGYCYMNISK